MVCFYIRLGMGAGRAAAVCNHGSHAGLKFVGRQACHPHPICRECISCRLQSWACECGHESCIQTCTKHLCSLPFLPGDKTHLIFQKEYPSLARNKNKTLFKQTNASSRQLWKWHQDQERELMRGWPWWPPALIADDLMTDTCAWPHVDKPGLRGEVLGRQILTQHQDQFDKDWSCLK